MSLPTSYSTLLILVDIVGRLAYQPWRGVDRWLLRLFGKLLKHAQRNSIGIFSVRLHLRNCVWVEHGRRVMGLMRFRWPNSRMDLFHHGAAREGLGALTIHPSFGC